MKMFWLALQETLRSSDRSLPGETLLLSGAQGCPGTLGDTRSTLHSVSATKHFFAVIPFLQKCQVHHFYLSDTELLVGRTVCS